MKRQVPIAVIVAPALLVVALVGYFFLVKPKQSEAGRLGDEIAELETKLEVATVAQRQPQADQSQAIKVADLFRVTKAMPDTDDMPGIILELNAVAAAAGVEFISISPQALAVRSSYSAIPINLTFEGNYYDLNDFLFRLRNLVAVRDGKLEAEGRLFTLDSLSLAEGPGGFPEIAAALTVSAYVYSTEPPAAPTAPAVTEATSTTSETTATTTAPEGESAP